MNFNLSSYWDRFNPKHKRYIVYGAAGGVLLGIFAFAGSGNEERQRHQPRDEVIRSVLTDQNTRNMSIDALAAGIQSMEREASEIRSNVEQLNKELERSAQEQGVSQEELASNLEGELESLRKELAQLQQQIEQDKQEQQQMWLSDVGETPEADTPATPVQPGSLFTDYRTANEVFEKSAPMKQERIDPETGERKPLQIFSHSQPVTKPKQQAQVDDAVFMPAGSILTGVLLTGLDAPTGQGARRDPFPITLRLQKEAILPNHFHADVRECFMIVSGYGDLSSERAYLRGETISCIREDGGVIESRINSYVVGEDGKAGLRGRLVSKQGAIIAKSLMAGFLGGAANAMDVDRVPTLNISPDGSADYQSRFSSDMMRSAGMQGASSALDRVAQFYIEMAESMFPIIEIDAGRQADVVLTSGMSLKILSK